MYRTLSARWRSPVAAATVTPPPRLGAPVLLLSCDAVPVVLRMLREAGTGRPGPLARLLAVLVLVGMIALAAPVLIPVVFWVLALL